MEQVCVNLIRSKHDSLLINLNKFDLYHLSKNHFVSLLLNLSNSKQISHPLVLIANGAGVNIENIAWIHQTRTRIKNTVDKLGINNHSQHQNSTAQYNKTCIWTLLNGATLFDLNQIIVQFRFDNIQIMQWKWLNEVWMFRDMVFTWAFDFGPIRMNKKPNLMEEPFGVSCSNIVWSIKSYYRRSSKKNRRNVTFEFREITISTVELFAGKSFR